MTCGGELGRFPKPTKEDLARNLASKLVNEEVGLKRSLGLSVPSSQEVYSMITVSRQNILEMIQKGQAKIANNQIVFEVPEPSSILG